MRVVVNELVTLNRRTGVGHYTAELLRGLRSLAGPHEVAGYPDGFVRRLCRGLYQTRQQVERAASGGTPSWPRRQFDRLRATVLQTLKRATQTGIARHFRHVVARERYDLYHEPNFVPLACDCPTVVTVHDLTPLTHPEWHPAERVTHFARNFQRGIERAVHVLTPTEHVRGELIRLLGVSPRRVTAIAEGVRHGLGPLPTIQVERTLARLGLPRDFLLSVGTIEPRKNLLMLLKAYCALPGQLRTRYPLLLVGGWGWKSEPIAAYLESEARHRGVRHLGYLDEDALNAVYNAARALVYPSHDEGFGLPPLEMLACGGAVLASTTPALVETIGGQAQLIPATDFVGWHRALAKVLSDDEWCQSLRRGATGHAAAYSWERCAAETLAVYRRLCGEPISEPLPNQPRKAG